MPGQGALTAYKRSVYRDPIGWGKRALGVQFWSKQREILRALQTNERVSVASSNAVGKTYLAAFVVHWWMNCHSPTYAITTSSSWTSLKKTLWPEIRRLRDNAIVPDIMQGTWNTMEWKPAVDKQWGAFAVSPTEAENFAGFRTPHGVLVVVDEASALEEDIMEAIMGLTASEGCKVFLIGNPLRSSGPFFDTFKSPLWWSTHISAFESPNVRSGSNLIPGLATKQWIYERGLEWGTSSPRFKARVLGRFPDEDESSLFPLWILERAQERIDETSTNDEGRMVLGVDVARYGDDDSVIQPRKGNYIFPAIAFEKKSTMETCGRLVQAIELYEPDEVNIDSIGVGAGVVDRMLEMGYSQCRGVNVASGPKDFGYVGEKPPSEVYENLRAQIYYRTREFLEGQGTLPKDSRILKELSGIRYGFTSTGKILIEKKEVTKKRIGCSPDRADALTLTMVPNDSQGDVLW